MALQGSIDMYHLCSKFHNEVKQNIPGPTHNFCAEPDELTFKTAPGCKDSVKNEVAGGGGTTAHLSLLGFDKRGRLRVE